MAIVLGSWYASVNEDILLLHLHLIDRVWTSVTDHSLSQVGRIAHLTSMLGQLLVGNYLDDTTLCWLREIVVGCCIRDTLDLKVNVLQVLLQVLLLTDLL